MAIGPSPVLLHPGQSTAAATVILHRAEGFDGAVEVAFPWLPPGVKVDPATVPPGEDSASIAFRSDGSTGPGSTSITAIGSSGGKTASATFTLTIQAAEVDAVGIDVQPAEAKLGLGGDAQLTVNLRRTGVFRTETLRVVASQLPAGVTADEVAVAPADASVVLTLHAAADAPLTGLVPAELDVFPSCASSCPRVAFTVFGIEVLSAKPDFPEIRSFAPAAAAIFVGERTQLSADFDGDSASIDGIGPIQAGVAVDTPLLSRTTSFVLRVRRGDQEVEAWAAVQVSYRNRIRALEAAPYAQVNHLAAALPDGRAMAMGGNTSETPNVPDSTLSQVFDPATDKFVRGPELRLTAQTRSFTSLAPLPDGGFMLAGTGLNDPVGPPLRSVATQLFDPAAGSFARSGDVGTRSIADRLATPLADGGVLLTGGAGPNVLPVDDADRYDPATGSWHTAGPMLHVREGHTATLLRDGRVLIAGGVTCCQAPDPSPEFFASSAEIYDPATGEFTATGPLAAGRALHAAALLADGRVLIAGGDGNDPSAPPLNAEIYDPATGRFTPAGDLRAARDSHAAVTLTDGRVLVIGGEVPPTVAGAVGQGVSSTEIFDPATGFWSDGPKLDGAFLGATVTLLRGGKVLVFGGGDVGGFPRADAALFE